MSTFIGREPELAVLYRLLAQVAGAAPSEPGRAVLITGPRRIGKSRLAEEFLARAVVPHAFLAATSRPVPQQLAELTAAVLALPLDEPNVVVIDDLPTLTASDPTLADSLQHLFDRALPGRRILLIGIGAEPAAMEPIGQPFHQQPITQLPLGPLTPSDLAARLQLTPAEAFDAYLITGGQPLVVGHWPAGASRWDFLAGAVRSPTSAMLVNGERVLAAELPTQSQARTVLTAIGAGQRTFANIGRAAGQLQQGSLSRALATLKQQRLIAAELPLSTAKSSETRYRVADPQLRFWLSHLGPALPEIERGRGDLVLARIKRSWTTWRASAIEPVLHEALGRLLAGQLPSEQSADGSVAVGGYWTRSNRPQIDVVLADRAPIATTVLAVGAIKWLEDSPFDDQDYGRLLIHRGQLPGAAPRTPVFAVSRAGTSETSVRAYQPAELLTAW